MGGVVMTTVCGAGSWLQNKDTLTPSLGVAAIVPTEKMCCSWGSHRPHVAGLKGRVSPPLAEVGSPGNP